MNGKTGLRARIVGHLLWLAVLLTLGLAASDLGATQVDTAQAAAPERKVIFIQGINSSGVSDCNNPSRDNNPQSFWARRERLKSQLPSFISDADIIGFSYAGEWCDPGPGRGKWLKPKYTWLDTHIGVVAAADRLNELIANVLRDSPNAKFDIVAHSLGGLVAAYWAYTKATKDPTFLRQHIHSIITLDSPLTGAPPLAIDIVARCDEYLKKRKQQSQSCKDLEDGSDVVKEIKATDDQGSNKITKWVNFVHVNSTFIGHLLPGYWRDVPPPCSGASVVDFWKHSCMLDEDGQLKQALQAVMVDVYDNRDSVWEMRGQWKEDFSGQSTNGWVRGSALVTEDKDGATLKLRNVNGTLIRVLYTGLGSAIVKVDGTVMVDRLPNQTQCVKYEFGHHGTFVRGPLCQYDIKVSPGSHTVEIETIPECPGVGFLRVCLDRYNFYFDALEVLAEQPPSSPSPGGTQPPSSPSPGGTQPPSSPPPGGTCTENVDVALIIDSSGSMEWNDPTGLRKEAARNFVTAMQENDQIAIVDFDSSAVVRFPLAPRTANPAPILTAIDEIDASGNTNIKDAVAKAFAQLNSSTKPNAKAAILLSDGEHNTGGAYTDADHQPFVDKGWPIYTVGLHVGGTAGEALLRDIAQDTRGQYFNLTDATQLIKVYNDLQAKVQCGQKRLEQTLFIAPRQTIELTVDIPSGLASATFLSNWTGSTVDMTLIAPDGRVIGPDTRAADVSHIKGLVSELYRIKNPVPGTWKIRLYGADVPTAGEPVTVVVTTVPKPDSIPPVSRLIPQPPRFGSVPLNLAYEASDPPGPNGETPSGVAHVELWYRHRSLTPGTTLPAWSPWTRYNGNFTASPIPFTPPAGSGIYEFYTIAVDNAGNREEEPSVADAQYLCLLRGGQGWCMALSGKPVPGP